MMQNAIHRNNIVQYASKSFADRHSQRAHTETKKYLLYITYPSFVIEHACVTERFIVIISRIIIQSYLLLQRDWKIKDFDSDIFKLFSKK